MCVQLSENQQTVRDTLKSNTEGILAVGGNPLKLCINTDQSPGSSEIYVRLG